MCYEYIYIYTSFQSQNNNIFNVYYIIQIIDVYIYVNCIILRRIALTTFLFHRNINFIAGINRSYEIVEKLCFNCVEKNKVYIICHIVI